MGWYREGEGGIVVMGKVEREYGIVVLLNSKYSVFNWGGR